MYGAEKSQLSSGFGCTSAKAELWLTPCVGPGTAWSMLGDRRSPHVGAGGDGELRGGSWAHGGRAKVEAIKANKAY